MKKSIILIALFGALLSSPAWAWGVMGMAGGSAAPAGCAGIACLEFEDTGTPAGVTTFGTGGGNTVDFDYTTGPIRGSESARLVSNSSGTYVGYYVSFDEASTIYAAGKFSFPVLSEGDNDNAIELRNSSGTSLCRVYLTWSTDHLHAVLKAGAGGSVADNTVQIDASTVYSWWIDYTEGSGANGTAHFYLAAATNTKPSVLLTATNGTITGQATRLYLETRYSDEVKFDHILVDDSDIGDLPE